VERNVRELSNALERALNRAAALAETKEPGSLSIKIDGDAFGATSPVAAESLNDLPFKKARSRAADIWARNTIESVLATCKGNVSESARKLKMSRTALIRLIHKYALK